MNFVYKKLAASEYGISMWLKVKAFRDAIQSMIDNNVTVSNTTVWPIMIEILNQNPNRKDIDGVSAGVLYNAYKEVRRGSYSEMPQDLASKFGQLYNKVMAVRKDEDYVVNPIQMDRFLDLVQFFIRKSKESTDSKVDPNGFTPKECHGGVTATFIVFDIYGDEVPEFCKVLKHCSAVTVDCIGDSLVQISCTVPNVFVHKPE